MKIQVNNVNSSNVNFSAKLSKEFLDYTNGFFTNKVYVDNLELERKLKKFVDVFETYGSENTTILHATTKKKKQKGYAHILALMNPDIDKDKALFLGRFSRLSDAIKFILNLSDKKMLDFEKDLACKNYDDIIIRN